MHRTSAKQSQFAALPRATEPQQQVPWAIVRNKANSEGPAGTRVRLCRTNPIRRANRAKQSQFAADGHGRPSPRLEALTMPPTGNKRAKQTQFPAGAGWGTARRVAQTNPIFAIMPIRRSAFPGGKSCETNPIRPRRVSGEDSQPTSSRIVRNKANLGRGSSLEFQVLSWSGRWLSLPTSDFTLRTSHFKLDTVRAVLVRGHWAVYNVARA
jgi:hypothetical protein